MRKIQATIRRVNGIAQAAVPDGSPAEAPAGDQYSIVKQRASLPINSPAPHGHGALADEDSPKAAAEACYPQVGPPAAQRMPAPAAMPQELLC